MLYRVEYLRDSKSPLNFIATLLASIIFHLSCCILKQHKNHMLHDMFRQHRRIDNVSLRFFRQMHMPSS